MEDRSTFWQDFKRIRTPLVLSWLWFFLVLFSYYCLKPLRDSLGTKLSGDIGLLYLATFVATLFALGLYSYLVSRSSRRQLLFAVYQFFAACLLGFFSSIPDLDRCPKALTAVFFVWVSVFNLYVVALFWSAMADLFTQSDGKRWFGTMAAAGSTGSAAGSILATLMSQWAGPRYLFIAAVVALEFAVVIGWLLIKSKSGSPTQVSADRGTGGSFYDGLTRVFSSRYLLGICGFVVLGKFAATFIYNHLQIRLDAEAIDAQARTLLFSKINLYSQSGSFVLQGLVVGLLIRFAGVSLTLMIPCAVFGVLFAWLYLVPALSTLAIAHIWQQIVSYGILVPAQHLLFTVVPREDKYKSKGFIDTVVFRASDVAAANAGSALSKWGVTAAAMAAGMLPVTGLWLLLGFFLGTWFNRRAEENGPPTPGLKLVGN